MVRYKEIKRSQYYRGTHRVNNKDHINSTERCGDVGRPTRWEQLAPYRESILINIEHMAAAGVPDYEIAQRIGIGSNTFLNWKSQILDVSEAYNRGRFIVSADLMGKAYEMAMGQLPAFEETVKETTNDDGTVKVERTMKKLPPDTKMLHLLMTKYLPHLFGGAQQIEMKADIKTTTEEDVNKILEGYGVTMQALAGAMLLENGEESSEEAEVTVEEDKDEL